MAEELFDENTVGRPNNPAAANKTDRVVFSDEEKDDYERFGAVPEPEPTAFGKKAEDSLDDKKNEGDDGKEEEKKVEVKSNTAPTTPTPPNPSAKG